jgi:hypothetical protein
MTVKLLIILDLAMFIGLLMVKVIQPQQPPISIVPLTCPAGFVSVPYECDLQALGGVPPYTWRISAGSLPEGISLNPATGVISGTPIVPFPPMNVRLSNGTRIQ